MRTKAEDDAIKNFENYYNLIYIHRPKDVTIENPQDFNKDIDKVLSYISELEDKVTVLENTKNICPITNTSGFKCDLKPLNNEVLSIIGKLKSEGKSDEYILGYNKGYAQAEFDFKQEIKDKIKELLGE